MLYKEVVTRTVRKHQRQMLEPLHPVHYLFTHDFVMTKHGLAAQMPITSRILFGFKKVRKYPGIIAT